MDKTPAYNGERMQETYPAARWRVLRTPPHDGATNMAIDEAILLAVAAGAAPPTLRFFAWDPPCLSLGYAQSVGDIDLARLRSHGYDLVRRATGGRAILHTDELTYSVTAPDSDARLSGGIVESYRRLSAGLLVGLERLGLNVNNHRGAPAASLSGPVCFEVPSNYEITAGGKKLVGSAQLRKQGVALQHGTLPLTGDITRICEVLAFDDEAARSRARAHVAARATTIADVLGTELDWETAATAMAVGFAQALNVELKPGALSDWELETVEQVRAEKYGNGEWTTRVA